MVLCSSLILTLLAARYGSTQCFFIIVIMPTIVYTMVPM
nr:MAG TPA: hypothetical protein [Caudoviricetes sp.]DAW10125.1 MAG TPA: hypothetical protein [Caudoviricetes sp.]